MLELIVKLLLVVLSGGNLCDLGNSVDWYSYKDTAELPIAIVRTQELWIDIYSDNYLFVFNNAGELGLDNQPHGECFIKLEDF